MSNIAIKFENISKQYRLGKIGTGTLSHDINRWWAKMRGKEDPYLKVTETNIRDKKTFSNYVWALKDINLEVIQGEVLGIIGNNGAGKSTLLKILSRVTRPTSGIIKTKGRIASLLEVGTGFHPEMTGRENIFMNGSIMGMTKAEIKRKFDEIVSFSDIEKYIDTPVKRYSSGMTVRLGFAIAAHLEPEILVVDEVLAVGDAEFQKKAVGKMHDLSNRDKRTVLFVSHNMGSIINLCNKGIILRNGSIYEIGQIRDVVAVYQNILASEIQDGSIEFITNRSGNKKVILSDIYLTDNKNNRLSSVLTGDEIIFNFIIKSNENRVKNLDIGFSLYNYSGERLSVVYSSFFGKYFSFDNVGLYKINFTIKKVFLQPGKYYLAIRILENNIESDWIKDKVLSFNVLMGDFYKTGKQGIIENTKFLIDGEWN